MVHCRLTLVALSINLLLACTGTSNEVVETVTSSASSADLNNSGTIEPYEDT